MLAGNPKRAVSFANVFYLCLAIVATRDERKRLEIVATATSDYG